MDSLGSHDIPSVRRYKTPSDRGMTFPQKLVQDSHRQKIWGYLIIITRKVIEYGFCEKLLVDLRPCAY